MSDVKSNNKEKQMTEPNKKEEKAASESRSSEALNEVLKELKSFREGAQAEQKNKELVEGIKTEVKSVKEENSELKKELNELKEEMKNMPQDTTGFAEGGEKKSTRIEELKSLQQALSGDRAQYREKAASWSWEDQDPRDCDERYEGKALSSIVDSNGGLLLVPSVSKQILEKRRQLNHIRQRATVIPNAAAINERITFEHDGNFPGRHETESTSVESISDILGKQQFIPFQRAVIIKIPERLLSGSVVAFEQMIVNHYARRLAELEENDFLNGDGSEKQADGLLPAIGAISSQKISTFDSTASGYAQFSILVDAKQKLLPEYKQERDQIVWLCSNKFMGDLMKMEDGNNRPYFLNPSAPNGMLPVLGHEAIELSNFADYAASTGSDVCMLANLAFFEIYDRSSMRVQRLNEKYIDEGKIGLRLTVEYDAGPVDKLAFVLVEHV